jgi:polysaccharide export outer membrane protein
MRYLGIIILLAVLIAGSASLASAQGDTTPMQKIAAVQLKTDDRYRIGFQDVLSVTVFRHPELGTQRVSVGPTGQVVLFRLDKPLTALCKTEQELADDIAAAYKANFIKDPQVNVAVTEQKSQSIGVMGAVEKPGSYFVSRRVHLLEMLALAGGPNKEAGTRLIVARTGSTSNCREASDSPADDSIDLMDFKIRDVQEGKQILWMKPGDVVSVLDADIVYVYGNVNKEGAVKIREPITLMQAIISAEGLRPAAKKDNVRVLRRKPGSEDREELIFDLNQIAKNKSSDPYLAAGDIVAVSEDRTKAILQGVAKAIKNSVPNAAYRLP